MFDKIRQEQIKREKLNKSAIGRELGLNRKTVKKYLDSNTPPKYQRTTRTRKDPFTSFESRAESLMKLTSNDISATEIYEQLVEEGYSGSERTVRRRIADLRLKVNKERFYEQKYEPGEQSQFDFKERVEIPFIDGINTTYFHFGTLPYSDNYSIRGYPSTNYECFIDGIHHFFESVGGMTKNVRIDNLSPCVTKVLRGSDRLYTNRFKQAISYYGFTVLPCGPGKGNEKGDVEREIRTHARRILNRIKIENIVFRDFKHLNEWLQEYCSKRKSDRLFTAFKEEQKHLLVTPRYDHEVACALFDGTANKYGTLCVDRKTIYSVPDFAIGKKCRLVLGPYSAKIYLVGRPKECIAVHPRLKQSQKSILLEHSLPSLIRKPQAMVRWAHRSILFPREVFKKYYDYLKKICPIRAEKDFLKSVNFVHNTSLDEIEIGMSLVMEGVSTTPFEDLRSVLFGGDNSCEIIEISKNLKQKQIKPDLENFNNLIPMRGVKNDK